MKSIAVTGILSLAMFGQQTQQLPDNPRPQVTGVGPVTPGLGTAASSTSSDGAAQATQPGTGQSAVSPADSSYKLTAPELKAAPNQADENTKTEATFTIRPVTVNYIEVPITVKDSKGRQVAGLNWRDFRIFENEVFQHISFFSEDSVPLSVAIVIDQSLPQDVMDRVNQSMGALQGAFTKYDEIAIYTYNNGAQERTTFTGAQSPRVNAVIARSQTPGREPQMYVAGPMAETTNINGRQFDPNTSPVRNSNSNFITVPKEVHTLNDAIDMAAHGLAKRPRGRRRILYVISDGKDAGSKAKTKDIVKFMQTNNITLDATLVGDASTWGVGYLDRFHIPFTMRENILPQYVAATGGQAISGYRIRAIEDSFSAIATEARTSYTAYYVSHAPVLDPSFRKIEVQVLRPGLDVIAKKGYYPTPSNVMGNGAPPQK